jgi:hypothetical protein
MMCRKVLCALALAVLSPAIVSAQTVIPGGYVSGTWTESGSAYLIQGDITIHADSTLTIEPGVEIIFQGHYILQVNGALAAIGTEMDSITFSVADTSIGWKGIRIAADADSSWLSYSVISYGRNTDGGGIYCASPNVVITHCSVTDNKASNNGGGICIFNGITNPPPIISNCVISRNTARFGGGVFYVADSMIISDCIINNNSAAHLTAETRGGGIYFDGGFSSSIHINDCTIQNNFCESDSSFGSNSNFGLGGGLYIHGRNNGGVLISNCQILTNWSRRSGGGIFIDLGGADITNCTIKGNFTKLCTPGPLLTLGGGGIGFSTLSNNSVISRCEIYENSGMGYSGGAIRAYHNVNASLTIESCTISKNYSFIGVGAIYFAGNLYLKDSIVAFSKSGNHSVHAGNAVVTFCNFFSNDGPDIIGPPAGFGTLTATNANGDSCDVYSNIFLDPLFADTANNDFQITWANWPIWDDTRSPCIDAGDPAGPLDPDSTVADMGALFFDQIRPAIAASDTLLDFGIMDIGQHLDLPLTIRNIGTDTLTIVDISNSQSAFTHNWNPVDDLLIPGDTLAITVTFTPADTNVVLDTLDIDNNDKPFQVQLIGKGHVVVGIEDGARIGMPEEYALRAPYPNPFNPVTTIEFDLHRSSEVQLKVFNILGEKIETLVSENLPAGTYRYRWCAGDLASGVYMIHLEAGRFRAVKKALLLK